MLTEEQEDQLDAYDEEYTKTLCLPLTSSIKELLEEKTKDPDITAAQAHTAALLEKEARRRAMSFETSRSRSPMSE